MTRVPLCGTELTTTALGFGCANLMGRLTRRESLRLLNAAFDSGVRHFDTAPLYGYGEAESVLGDMLKSCRSHVTVATKFGIAPPKRSAGLSAAKSAARAMVTAFPQLRRQIRRRAERMTRKSSFTVNECRQSLHDSLRKLRTDYIDVWLLHEVAPEQMTVELIDFLENTKRQGLIREYGTATTPRNTIAIRSGWLASGRIVQIPNSVFENTLEAFPNRDITAIITHSALGAGYRVLTEKMRSDRELRSAWSRELGIDCGDLSQVGTLLLAAAMKENSTGVVLFSSLHEEKIHQNGRLLSEAKLSERQLLAVKWLVLDFLGSATITEGRRTAT
jgi:aryl-alcohol dehydrogenase-like predicted oxidoreductase